MTSIVYLFMLHKTKKIDLVTLDDQLHFCGSHKQLPVFKRKIHFAQWCDKPDHLLSRQWGVIEWS